MSYTLTINADAAEITRLKKLLSHIPNSFRNAAKKAAGDTLRQLKKTAGDEASRVYAMSPAKIRKAIKLYATSGTLKVTGRRQNLSDYTITPKSPGRKRRILRGMALGQEGMKEYPRGFLIHGRNSGKVLAFIRTGSKRDDIEKLIRPAVPQMMENEEVSKVLSETAERTVLEKLRLYANMAVMEGR